MGEKGSIEVKLGIYAISRDYIFDVIHVFFPPNLNSNNFMSEKRALCNSGFVTFPVGGKCCMVTNNAM